MKIQPALMLFLFAARLYGQAPVSTAMEAPATGQTRQFTLTEKTVQSEVLSGFFRKYEVYEAPLDQISHFTASEKSNFTLSLEFGQKDALSLDLRPVSLWDGTAIMYIATEDGVQQYPMPASTTYRGNITGNPGARVACSFADGFSSGLIEEGERLVYWEPLFRYIPDAPHNWIIRYEASDVIPHKGNFCGLSDEDIAKQKINVSKPEANAMSSGCYELELAQAADWSMWQKYGGATGVVTYITSVINQVQLNYDNEFTNGITFRIVGVWLSSCSNCDPWTTSTDSGTLLNSFQSWGNGINGFPGLTWDVAELWTNRDFDGSVVGLAFLGTACTFSGYHEIQDWTTGDLLRCTVSHETGHNLNATHDPSGSPTIMAPAANSSNTWSAQSLGEINPFIQNAINNVCFFPCSSFHYEYGKVGEEGFSNRNADEVIQTSTFYDCEPVWMYFSFNQINGGATVEGKTELILPGGTMNSSTFTDGPAPANGWLWLRYTQYYNFLPPGTYVWKLYQRAPSGDYILVSTKTINVIDAPNGLACGEKMHLRMNGNTQDVSGLNNHAIVKSGTVTYGMDHFGNCNGAVRLTNGAFLEAPVINERAVSFWFKMNTQDQMVIYDSGPNGEESKDFAVGVYKPNGLWGNASFDNTYGVFFSTGGRDIAIPFDAIKTGWHHVVVSRVADGYNRFRLMIDGQFPGGYFWDGIVAGQPWTQQTQPFTFPADGNGVPNLFVPTYKTYMGRDSQQINEFFDGWLDEVRVFDQLLDMNEMTALYTTTNDNPNNINASTSLLYYCEGQTIQLNATANNATGFAWTGPANFSSSQQNPAIPNATTAMSGTYTMTVNITGGCIVTDTVNLNVNIKPAVSTTGVNECAGATNGSATAVASGGTGLMYHWSNGQTSSTITGLPGGVTYTVTVTNSGACSATSSVTLTTIPAPSASITNTVTACFNQTNGSTTVTASGGVTPYQYAWSNGQTTATASNLAAGTYTVTITSGNGCTVTATAVVATASTPVAGISSTTTTCANATDGSAAVVAGGGIPPYQYHWSSGQTTATVFNLAVGNYTVTVTGTNGCFATATATIDPIPTPVATISTINGTCFGESDGSATVSVTGGLTPYQYIWTSGSGTNMATNLPVGTYTVTVYGGNGCSASASATIPLAPTPVATISDKGNSCSGQSNGFATVAVNGGAAPFQYIWNNGQTTPTASNLAAGTYTVTVTGTNGCTGSATAFIGTSSAPTPSATATNACANLSNGSATVTVIGGTPPYQYAWSNGQSTATASNLAAGTYTVTVTSNGGCSATTTATVGTSSTPVATISSTTSTCSGQTNGSATATASGGATPYQYAWSNSQTTATISSLAAGSYTVTVTGNNGCSATATATVGTSSTPVATIASTTSACPGQTNGAATVTVSGGATPYQYAWNNGQTTATASNMAAGTYTVTVTGNNGCTATTSATVSTASAPVATIASTTGPCPGQSNGSATVTVTGGATPYQYAWSNGQTTATASNLIVGTYTVTVTGSNGCSSTASAMVSTASVPVATIASTTAACAGQTNGSATVSVSGGATPYQYMWNNGQTTATASSLAAGTYTVTVTGNNGCSSTASATVITATAPVATISSTTGACTGQTNGAATVTATGGTTPYQYSWSNGQTTATATNLAIGTYTVTVTGNNGCSATATAIVNIAATPTLNTTTIEACIGQSNGAATVTASGGVSPFQYSWNNGQTGATVSNLPAGTYTVTVTGNNGCTVSTTAAVGNSPAISVSINTEDLSTGLCKSTVTAGGGVPPFTFAWSNGETLNPAIGLPNGTFTVTVTDAHGCTATTGGNCTAVGVSDIDGLAEFRIYPNPSSGIVRFVAHLRQPADLEIKVFDLLGTSIYRNSLSGDNLYGEINLTDQPEGLYFVEVRTGASVKVVKFVIAR